jgi:regulator of replication initiation timing
MKAVEGEVGQSTPDLSNVLFRTLMADGNNLLETLHSRGFLKKVPTNQVIVTPNAQSTIRLDELNRILNEMSKGEEAVKKLAEMDSSRGMAGKKPEVIREVGVPQVKVAADENSVLSDSDIAKNLQSQAEMMKRQAKELLAESKRLEEEAKGLSTSDAKPRTAKKAASKKKQAA